MSNERVAVDTNIVLYILGGDKAAHELVKGRDVVASAMVRMEAMVYHGQDAAHLKLVQTFLERCEVVEIHRSVQDLAVDIRLRYRLKGTSKCLERMANAAIVRTDKAQRREDTGNKYPTEGQRSMAEREQVLTWRPLAFNAAGARFFEVP